MRSWILRLGAIGLVALLSACATGELDTNPEPIGDFRLGFFVPSTAPEVTKGPASREASDEEWKAALKAAFEPRFQRYKGGEFFHIGAIVDGYVLAQPGIPVVLAPKSVLIFRVTIIEDATGNQYPEEPHQITVVESVGAGTILGSGLTSTKEEQLADLAENAAAATEKWMRDQPWFGTFSGTTEDLAAAEELAETIETPDAEAVEALDEAPLTEPVVGEPLSVIDDAAFVPADGAIGEDTSVTEAVETVVEQDGDTSALEGLVEGALTEDGEADTAATTSD